MSGPSTKDDLGQLLAELADSQPVTPPPWDTVAHRRASDRPERGRQLLVTAIAIIAVVLVAGAVVLSRRPANVSTEPIATPAEAIETPALLAPSARGPASSTSEIRPQATVEEPRGALSGSSGTIYSLILAPATEENLPGDLVNIAGFDATVMTDGSAPTQIYRTVDLGCLFLTVTTADAPALSSELTELMESIRVDATTVTIEPPSAWTSYGTASPTQTYLSTSQIRTDDGPRELSLSQSPGAPIGYYLFGETAPVLLASDGTDQLWHIASATTPGHNSLVGTQLGTAFRISGNVSVDQLRSVAETLTAATGSEALPPSDAAEETPMTIEAADAADRDCSTPPPTMTITD